MTGYLQRLLDTAAPTPPPLDAGGQKHFARLRAESVARDWPNSTPPEREDRSSQPHHAAGSRPAHHDALRRSSPAPQSPPS